MENLHTLPTETLVSLAGLTRELRAKQYLRALHTPALKELLLIARQRSNASVAGLVRVELDRRAEPFDV